MASELLLAQTAVDLPVNLPDVADPNALRVVADGILSIGFVAGAYRVGRRAVMGYYLPDDMSDFEMPRTTTDRDPRWLAVMGACYVAGVALTAAAVALVMPTAYALAWAGVWALVAAVVALMAAKDASPVDDVRLLAEARRK